MFSHVVVGSNDIEKSRKFYDAVFGVLGIGTAPEGERLIYRGAQGSFMVTKPINGEPACFANGGTIGFAMESEEQCKAWHDAGVAAGGASCEDPPGLRELPFARMYLSYLRDPDGNKLCGVKYLK
jgi:catechol 2,3-dioxygenase-like lactoylglutathione lyase family enzyme